jgi:heat shock protein HslJ
MRTNASLVFIACLALVGCGSSVPSTPPPASDPTPFDLSGTAWRATSVGGQPIPAEDAPFIEFDWLGRPDGYGYTGCDQFGFEATIQGDRMSVGDLMRPPSSCAGPKGQVEQLFLAAFQATEAWSVDGDRLTLAGVPGRIVLARDLPPMGDPGRQVADALTDGEWSVVDAPGVVGLEGLPPVRFTDTRLIAAGGCGFSGDIQFDSGGALDIGEVGWDVAGCDGGPDDGRVELKRLLEAVTLGRPGPDGTIVLSGPQGEVVLGR